MSAALEELLADDVVLHGDGGGKVPALARALFGSRRVARTLAAWFRQGAKVPDPELREVEVNGQPGAVSDGRRRHRLRHGARHRRRRRCRESARS